jgi:AcrR family transcriptional regulator
MTMSPAALRVCQIAVEHFSERGYDGSSLSDIADQAGMRKASLYSHFKSKDDLVWQILAMALENERTFASESFLADTGQLMGETYLARLSDRFTCSAELRFLLRTAYAPPVAIRENIVKAYAGFVDSIRDLFISALPAGMSEETANLLTEGYLGAVDAVQVELLYSGTATAERRGSALWALLRSYADQNA